MVGTSILGSWNSHWSESHSNQNGRYRVKNPTWTRSLFLPAPAFGGMESNNGLQNGDTMVILWWYYGYYGDTVKNKDGIIHIYIYIYIFILYIYTVYVKWHKSTEMWMLTINDRNQSVEPIRVFVDWTTKSHHQNWAPQTQRNPLNWRRGRVKTTNSL